MFFLYFLQLSRIFRLFSLNLLQILAVFAAQNDKLEQKAHHDHQNGHGDHDFNQCERLMFSDDQPFHSAASLFTQ